MKKESYKIETLIQNINLLTEEGGIYTWNFVPKIDVSTSASFIESFNNLSQKSLRLQQEGKVGPSNIKLHLNSFEKNVIGESRYNDFKKLSENLHFRHYFSSTLEKICEEAMVLYIGKADNILRRIQEHFDSKGSSLKNDLKNAGISNEELILNVFYIPDDNFINVINVNKHQLLLVEEVIQRLINPGFVKKFG